MTGREKLTQMEKEASATPGREVTVWIDATPFMDHPGMAGKVALTVSEKRVNTKAYGWVRKRSHKLWGDTISQLAARMIMEAFYNEALDNEREVK